jgi:predicted RNase H-like HicB family nuclease
LRYAIVIEKAERNYSAYVPDLPGCVATAPSVEAAEQEIREAIRFHIDGLKEDGLPVPKPTTWKRKTFPLPTGEREKSNARPAMTCTAKRMIISSYRIDRVGAARSAPLPALRLLARLADGSTAKRRTQRVF